MTSTSLHISDHSSESKLFSVVVNHEEQHALWPAHKSVPNGWRSALPSASKEDCLHYVRTHWTDMRPLSLRLHETRN